MEMLVNTQRESEEYQRIKAVVTEYFTAYYTERDCARVMKCFTEDALFVGLMNDEISNRREQISRIIQTQMSSVSKPIPYFVNCYIQQPCGKGMWNCYSMLDMNVALPELGTTRYHIRQTITVVKEKSEYRISAVHVSEAANVRNQNSGGNSDQDAPAKVAQSELGRIMSQVIPGGIVSKQAEAGFPISVVNDQFLKMFHFNTYCDLSEFCSGRFQNLVHPDDLEKFQYTARFILSSGKQCECEYRVQRSDGSYLWVLDSGRKAVSTDGKDIIVSVLTDISNQVQRTMELERENEIDCLTSIYNRKGAFHRIEHWESFYDNYAFCILDIDNFKQINDLYGHKQGDVTLIHLADMLEQYFGDQGVVGRLGGDEFSVFLPNIERAELLRASLEILIQGFQDKMKRTYPDASATLSVGGICGKGPIILDAAFDLADNNLYRIKRGDKNGVCLSQKEE